MYLKITNKGSVSRKYLELIGATDKRERISNSDVIGNKGSGAKLAVVPGLRLGHKIAISSNDSIGKYILCYETESADLGNKTVKQIVFKYWGNGSFPSMLTLDAFQDWDQPIGDDNKKVFKMLREYICNAWDEDKKFTIEKVNDIHQAKPEETSVFISLSEEIEEILSHVDRYFKIINERKPLFIGEGIFSPIGKIYPKSEEGITRLFSQGVLVDCKKASYYSSLFDYSLDNKSLLSEERIIKDFARFIDGIGNLLLEIDDNNLVNLLLTFMIKEREGVELELKALGKKERVSTKVAERWKTAWKSRMGDKAIIASNNTQLDEDAKNRGFTVISNLPYELVGFLKRCGVTNSKDVAGTTEKKKDEPDFEIIGLDESQQIMFDEAYTRFLKYYPEASRLPVICYRPLKERLMDDGGHCGLGKNQYKQIWIVEKSLVSVKRILMILVHEYRHCFKEEGDYSREFTQEADVQIVDLMLANAEPPDGSKNIWLAKIISGRGIIIPHRFVGLSVHVLVRSKELRLIIGNIELKCLFEKEVSGKISQERKVTKFKNLGCVFLPTKIIGQLPKEIELEIR
ncbi:MAG: hypothetical protein KAI57_02510 [Candidatus Pacebacteria bacterium]|nr:hypothetical protein [Candidatus Paceibacterota bacterium]